MDKSTFRTSLFVSTFGPALVVLLAVTTLLTVIIMAAGRDPVVLARVGTMYSEGDPEGTEGYDGQFVLSIAQELHPDQVSEHLDIPAYRYQRILLPLLARLLSVGEAALIPWLIPIIGVLAHTAGTWGLGELFSDWGINRWYTLIYGFWVGFLLALMVDLPEPLAYGLVTLGYLALHRGRSLLGWMLLGLSLFAKEVTLLFIAATMLAYILDSHWRDAIGLATISLLPYAIFQGWLWLTFGQPGLGSGGAMATPFEWIPFMGFLRIGYESIPYLLAMFLVFGPAVILPSIWGAWKSLQFLWAGQRNMIVLSLLLNCIMIATMPFSTFRETGGVLRIACGLVTAILFFAAIYRQKRVLNYSAFWIVLCVFLFK